MTEQKSTSALYQFKGKIPVESMVSFGLQHILAMLVSNFTPAIIVASACGLAGGDMARLIQSTMLIAGIGTLIQLFPLWHIGAGLPIVTGLSFTFVSIFCYIGTTYGYETILGAVLIGGVIEGVLGLLATFWIRFISPVVSSSVVTAIGLSLLPVGAKSFGGGEGSQNFGSTESWIIGGVTLLVCIFMGAFGKGFLKKMSVLFGLVVGYVLAICMGVVDFSGLAESKIVGLPAFLSYDFKFELPAILSVVCIYLVSATEAIGATEALTNGSFRREAKPEEMRGAISCNGFVSALSSVFGCLPITTYAQNIGLVNMTRVVNRRAIGSCAVILILAGFFPIIGDAIATVPSPVLGGCTIMMFGSIVVSGIEMIGKAGFSARNITIVSLSLAVGVGFTSVPELFNVFPDIIRYVFGENCVALVFILALFLDLILPKDNKKENTEKSA